MGSENVSILQLAVSFFNNSFFIIAGGVSTIIVITGFLYVMFLVIKGVLPVWYRLGMGLSKRKIAVFASDEYASLESMLADSKIFKRKNIMRVNKNDIRKAEDYSLLVVYWKDFSDKLKEILSIKKDSAALVVYAPQNEGIIDKASIDLINEHRNAIVVNFRGRLLNDIVSCLITTCYEQR